jgi:hypothetical protein
MGIVNDKKSIVTEISVLTSIGKTAKLPDSNFTFPSVNTKNEPIPFMLDLLTATIGSEALQRATGNIMTKFIRSVEPQLKGALKKQSNTPNSNQVLPAGFNAGYTVPAKKLDMFGKLKTDPSSAAGSLTYADNPNGFDKVAYNAMLTPGSDNIFGNLKMNYDDVTDTMTFKPTNPGDTIGGFTTGLIDGMTIINEKEFTTAVMDVIYGTASKASKKPLNNMVEEEKVRQLIQQLIDGADVAGLSDEEIASIQRLAKDKSNGIVAVDVGCSIIDSSLFLDDILDLISQNTGSTDPVFVGNNYNKVMENSFGKNPEQVNPKNKNAVRDGFFKRLIKTILNAIVFALTATPQIRALIMILNGFKNNDNPNTPSNTTDDINSQKNFVKCLADSAGALLNEFIFNLLKTELVKLIIPVASLLLKEKISAFIRIIQSLFT